MPGKAREFNVETGVNLIRGESEEGERVVGFDIVILEQ